MNTLANILKGKCPNCKKDYIFKSKGNFLLFRIPKMNERCQKCNFKFEKEPGFFFGAMYVSYALAVAQMIACFIIFWVIIDLSPLVVFFIIAFIVMASMTFNFRVSRAIWIYLFR